LTVAVAIEWLNQARFRLGDDVVCQFRVTNTGAKPIVLPWDPDSDVLYGKDCKGLAKLNTSTLEGFVGFRFIDAEGRAWGVGAHRLFGLRDNPTTYCLLLPQNSARIRASGKVYLPELSSKLSLGEAVDGFKFRVVFDLNDSSIRNAYETLVSENYRDVILEGR
jgi:hypothetical protein